MDERDRPLGLGALRRLHDLIGRVNGSATLADTLQAVVDGVVEVVGFDVAAVSLAHADGSFETVAVAGDAEARSQLLGHRESAGVYEREFALADHWGSLRFVPHERLPGGIGSGWVPDVAALDLPDAWHPQDALFAPLRSPSGELVGMLSVDLPHDRRRPGTFQREMLEMFAAQAGIAVDNARLTGRLQASEEAFRLAFEGAGTGMAVIGMSTADPGRYLQVNPALCRIVGHTPDELLSGSFLDITHPDDRPRDVESLQRAASGSDETYRTEKRYLHADGHSVWVAVTMTVMHDAGGVPLYAISQVEDVGDRRSARQQLAHRARHDVLTGLPNRDPLRERLAAAVESSRTDGRTGAVLFCDLDGFKAVNDQHGHAVGDQVLTVVARRMAAASRRRDIVARLGGDEFIVVAEDITSAEAGELADRLQAAAAEPIAVLEAGVLRITGSIGIAMIDHGAGDAEDLMRLADRAMYRAKLSGGNAHAFHEQAQSTLS